MTNDCISVPARQLGSLVAEIFVAAGLSRLAAERVAEGLIDADLEGVHSHGVMLVEMYVDRVLKGSVTLKEQGTVVNDRDAVVVLDAGHALGHLTGDQSMSIAIERARRYGIGVVAVRHAFHFGMASRYALQATRCDCVGIAMCNTRPLMPAPGGAEPAVGNNPISIAVPSADGIPIVLDMASSEAAMGKIRMAEKAGQKIPVGWATRADGAATVDPAEAIAGMLLPMAGAKGFGLAFLIDLLSGLLSSGASGANVRPLYGDFSVAYDCSHFFIAMHVAHFCNPEQFKEGAAAAARRVRAGRRTPDCRQLFTPGEIEYRRRVDAAGFVQIDSAVIESLMRTARQLGVQHEFENAEQQSDEGYVKA